MTEALPPPDRPMRIAAALLLLLWLASLALRVATLTRMPESNHVSGAMMLVMGWLGALMFQFAWFANPLLWIALPSIAFMRVPRPWLLRCIAVLLCLCGLSALFWNDMPDDSGSNYVLSYGPGYYLWLLAVFGTAAAAIAKAQPKSVIR